MASSWWCCRCWPSCARTSRSHRDATCGGSLKLLGIALAAALLLLFAQYKAIFRAGNVSNKYIVYTLVPINIISSSVNVTTRAMKPWFQTSQKDIVIDAKVRTPDNL